MIRTSAVTGQSVTFRARRAATRDVVLLVLALLLLAGAALIYWRAGGGEEGAPTDAKYTASFVCEGCGHYFGLTAAELERAIDHRETRGDAQTRQMWFRCPACKEMKSVRAARCPEHGDVIKLQPGPSDPVKCSKCDFCG
ncbi:MAG: hypothetical protein AB7Q17_17940 [Phycisphaerae bacterium]